MPEIIKTRLRDGVWEGDIAGLGDDDNVDVTIRDIPVDYVTLVRKDDGIARISVPVPSQFITEGVNTFMIRYGDQTIGSFTLIAGDLAGDDLRAEVEMLRTELDMLKKAFRRHVRETM
ncbi:MAG: hypothetical protein ACPG5U_08450 [Planktomarina sp.]